MVSNLLSESTYTIGQGLFFDTGVFAVLLILSTLILANILRRKIPFMRRSMMPTAVIGGLLLMVIRAVLQLCGVEMFGTNGDNMLFLLTYHTLPIGFIALGLRDKQSHEGDEHGKADAKAVQTHPARTGAMIVSGYMMQAVVGIGFSLFLGFVLFPQLNPGVGIILPLGFGQGPGQATNGGELFQSAAADGGGGMANARAFGIAVAALGFLWASIGGLIMLNRIAKKRGVNLKDRMRTAGDVSGGLVEEADEIPLSESIDKFTIQACLIGFIYIVTLGFCMLLDWGLSYLGDMGARIAQVFWGFNFCFGIAFAMLFKWIMNRLRKKKWMNRKYVNNYMLNRISGFAFDVMIIASLASLELAALGQLWIPLLIITTAGGVATLFYVRYICNKMYPGYKDEAFITMYGMLTGTLSNGIILLRELDPEFRTPAALDQVFGSATALIFGIPMLILLPIAVADPGIYYVFGIVAVYFVFLVWIMLGRFGWLARIFKRKKAAFADGQTAAASGSADAAEGDSGERE
ncbi:sodium:glutamate symporter [Clostridia bacterium]|nr:sodium:glutamate symporter [Clostridia bacterium]